MKERQILAFNLPETVRAMPIERFPLKLPLYNKLKDGGVNNVAELVETLDAGNDVINKSQKERVKAMISDLCQSLLEAGDPDWSRFCELQQLPLIPREAPIETDADILENLGIVIEEILSSDARDERKWQIIQHRYGLNGRSVMTQEDLGHAFGGITRQRVEQLESKYISELREALLDANYSGKHYLVDDRVIEYLRTAKSLISVEAFGFVRESVLLGQIVGSSGTSVDIDPSVLNLLLELFGLNRITDLPKGVPTLWNVEKTFGEKKLIKALRNLEQILTKDYLPPIDGIELLAKLNRSMGRTESLSQATFQQLVQICDYIEITPDGQYQTKIERIQSRAGQAERLLVEAGKPVDVKELADQLNKKLTAAGLKNVEYLNFGNALSADKRFVAEAKSGRRALKSWDIKPKSILQLMEEALTAIGRPAGEAEIFDYVKERRPVSERSITAYLSGESRFEKVGFEKWQLATSKTPDGANTNDDIGKVVIEEFDRRGLSEMPFPELLDLVSERTGIDPKRLRGVLRHHPVVTGRRTGWEKTTTAVLNRNYKVDGSQTGKKRNRKAETLYQKSEHLVRQLLSNEPSNELELSYLVSQLKAQLGLQKQTAYQYISKIPFIEKIPVPGTTVRICRLKIHTAANYPKLGEIDSINPHSGKEARRAVAMLTEAEVDIGLFLLGRLFESSLKSYLLAVQQTGFLEINDGNLEKLNNMIQWIKNKKIVSDGPTLSYLQAQRNERAHGQAPDLKERQRLVESAPWGANLYLTYILLFETKRLELGAAATAIPE